MQRELHRRRAGPVRQSLHVQRWRLLQRDLSGIVRQPVWRIRVRDGDDHLRREHRYLLAGNLLLSVSSHEWFLWLRGVAGI